MEGSLVAYKVFTNGSVLQASEVNENLMQQAVATFSNAAARTAAITSPAEGQVTYLQDTDRYEHWTGSSWVSPFGMTLLSSVAFTSSGGTEVSNVFSSAYDNYKVFINVIANASGVNLLMRFRDAGGNVSTPNYSRQVLTADGSTVAASRATSQGETQIGVTNNTQYSAFDLTFYNPNRALTTNVVSTGVGGASGGNFFTSSSLFNANNVFTGFVIFPPSSLINGNIRIYGIRN
jgi:hypothetical protein